VEEAVEAVTLNAGAALRLAAAVAVTCCVGACSRGPTEAQVAADFHAIYRHCNLASSGPGERDSDNVRIVIAFRCGDHDNREQLLYQRFGGAWELSWIDAPRDRHLGRPRVGRQAALAMAEQAARNEGLAPERCKPDPFVSEMSADAREWQFAYICGQALPVHGPTFFVDVDRYTGKTDLLRGY
jgi:hypothetical protein